jgi:hypothetical protein
MAERRHSRNVAKRPCILVVDDNLSEAHAKRLLFSQSVESIARTPDDVTLNDLKRADLALVDLVFDEWVFDLSSRSIAEHPNDGVALAAVLRSHCTNNPPTAFALHSGRLDGLSGGFLPGLTSI